MIDLSFLRRESISDEQRKIVDSMSLGISQGAPLEAWRTICDRYSQSLPPEIYRQLWDAVFGTDLDASAPRPMWIPDSRAASNTPLGEWMNALQLSEVAEFHQWSVEHREDFWSGVLERLDLQMHAPPQSILDKDSTAEDPNWLPGARLNIVESCFLADPDHIAVVAGRDGSVQTKLTVAELERQTTCFAYGLELLGYKPGDRIAVYMPMTVESIVVYLGILHAGCIAVSIADSFAPPEIANRLRISNAVGVVTYDVMVRNDKSIELYKTLQQASELPTIVIADGDALSEPLRGQDIAWNQLMSNAAASSVHRVPHIGSIDSTINILFSSGTTGDPKAIPWTQSTPIKCAADAMLLQGIEPGDVVAWPTNLGWMMGPWLIFAALLRRATIALHEDVPVGKAFGAFIENARVNMLGVVPTLVKAWRSTRCMEEFDWTQIRCFSSTGESSQAEDMFYLSSLAGFRPVIEYCGGTEIGGGYISSTLVQPNAPSTFTTYAFGIDGTILDENGKDSDEGELWLVPPSIGLSQTLLNRDHHETYYSESPAWKEGVSLRRHGDHFRKLPGGYFAAGGRVDDTMNLGGIKVSSAEIERVLNQVGGIRETAAIAVNDVKGGISSLVVFVVLDAEREEPWHNDEPALLKTMNQTIREQLNPLFRVSSIRLVDSLPRTASNKVMRRLLRDRLQDGVQ